MPDTDKSSSEIVKKSLLYSIWDGFFYSVMVGFGESFLSAFAVFLRATNTELGILGSLPQTLGALSQLLSHRVMGWIKSRKRLIVVGALLSGLMYLPITLVFFLGMVRVYHLIAFVCMYWICSTIISPAWNSWMGDLVNPKERGTYFGRRNKIAGFATFFSFIIAGYILQQYGGDSTRQYMGYVIIFVIAMFARIVSMIFLTMMHEPEYHVVPEAYFGFLDFVKKARYNNYGIFVIYSSLMNFGVFISGPFFTAYMLRDLHLNYIEFTAIQAAAILMKNLSMPLWGMASDRFGTKRVLTLGGFLMPMVPILWSLSRNFWYLIFVQFYSGLVWAAFELAAFNFIFDITTPQKRATCVAYYNVFIGISTLVGAVIGGFILTHTPEFTLGSKFYLLFIISGILRYAASFIFLPKIKEVRVVEHVPYHTLFLNVVTTLPTTGYSMFNFIHNIAQQLPGKIEKGWVKEVSELIKETSKRIEEQRIVKGVSEVTREARELIKKRRLFGKVKKNIKAKARDSHEKGK